MENFDNQPKNFDDEKRGLVVAINKLGDGDIVKLAKTLGYNNIEGPEEALKFIITSVGEAADQDDFQTIQRKFNNLDEIEV